MSRCFRMPRQGGALRLIPCLFMAALALPAAAGETQKKPLVFHHEEYGVAQLETLKRKYDYDEYMEKGLTEFERFNLLKRWTYDTVTYGGAKQYTQLRNALTILEKAKRGEVFWCNNISAVYMQCALSLGYTSRYVFLRNTKGESHIANDIWSNQYRKWIFIDPTWNVYLEKDGVPLSLLEVKDEWRKNNGADLIYVYGAGDNERRYTKAELPITRSDNFLYRLWPVTDQWISFMYQVGIVGRNNLFTHEDGTGAYIWDTIYTIKDEINSKDSVWEFRRYPSPPLADLFHELNRVDISRVEGKIAGKAEGTEKDGKEKEAPLVFKLDAFGPANYTPNFQSYEVQLDSGEWQDSGSLYAPSALKPGKHQIAARARNKFGVRGPATVLEFSVDPSLIWPFSLFLGK